MSSFETPYGLEITRIGRGMAMTMLFAHWLYLLGSVLHMLENVCVREVDSDTEDEAEPNDSPKDESDGNVKPSLAKAATRDKLKRMDTMQPFLHASSTATGSGPAPPLQTPRKQPTDSPKDEPDGNVKRPLTKAGTCTRGQLKRMDTMQQFLHASSTVTDSGSTSLHSAPSKQRRGAVCAPVLVAKKLEQAVSE